MMNALTIDLRDGFLRMLVVQDGSVRYAKIAGDFPSDDKESSQERLAAEITEAAWKRGTVSVILPSPVLKYVTYHIPSMNIEDAAKVANREISRELKGQPFTLGIRRITGRTKGGAAGQEILAEYMLSADSAPYLDLLKRSGIRPHRITSSLDGNVHFFQRFRSQTDGNEALLDIGTNVIEIAVFNNGHLLRYEKKTISHGDDEAVEGKAALRVQADKMRIYRIVDLLYNFHVSLKSDAPEQELSAIWVCGIGSLTEGIADSISDGLGVTCSVVDLSATIKEKGSAFTALSGEALLSEKEHSVNFIPAYVLDEKKKLLRRIVLAASLSFYVLLLMYGYAALTRADNTLRLTYERARSDQASRQNNLTHDDTYDVDQTTCAKLLSTNKDFYNVFRDIANLTPQGVNLERIEIQGMQDITHLKMNAVIRYNDENFKNTLLSKFLISLDKSGSLKRVSPPEISLSQSVTKEPEISIKAIHEVIR